MFDLDWFDKQAYSQDITLKHHSLLHINLKLIDQAFYRMATKSKKPKHLNVPISKKWRGTAIRR